MKLLKAFKAFYHDETGAASIEYGLIIALIAIAIIGATRALGTSTSDSFQNYNDELEAAKPA